MANEEKAEPYKDKCKYKGGTYFYEVTDSFCRIKAGIYYCYNWATATCTNIPENY